MAKKQSSEPITEKIKRLNHLLVTNINNPEVEKLKAEINYFYWGAI